MRICESDKMNPSSASTSTSRTLFSDLNDDCLLEVLKHLDLTDLCAAADVCRRFRQNSQRYFPFPKFKNEVLHIYCSDEHGELYLRARDVYTPEAPRICLMDDLLCQKLLRISKFLRNFGVLVKSIHISGPENDSKIDSKYEKNILELVSLYCSGTLNRLDIQRIDLAGENEITLRPLVLHLQKLRLHDC